MSFEIKAATRVGIIPWIDLYSESGCGKTMSSLLLARGIAGTKGKIVLADSESKRGSLYADVIPGGYDVIDFGEPFSPAVYVQVADAIFKSGAAVGVIDSMSHEWEGIGGVLDMAGENERKSGKGLHNWVGPKLEHSKLVQFLLRSPIPLICCIRAKYKTRQGKENGKTVVIKDDYASPIQAEDFIFEATAHAEILQDHSVRLTKCSHPDLRKCFPEKGPIKIEHGEAIARWCAAGGKGAAPISTGHQSDPEALKRELWSLTRSIHKVPNGEKDKATLAAGKNVLQRFLTDECAVDLMLDAMSIQDLERVIKTVQFKLNNPATP